MLFKNKPKRKRLVPICRNLRQLSIKIYRMFTVKDYRIAGFSIIVEI